MIEPAIQGLLDKQACTELVYKLARAIDRCDAELLTSLFHPDATDDHGVFVGTAADFATWVMPVLHSMKRTQHVVGNVLITLDGDKAYGESYFIAHHTVAQAGGDDIFTLAAGRYLDRFERRGGEWRIAHRHADYDWNSTVPSTDTWDRTNPGAMTYCRRAPEDLSYSHFAGIL